MDQESWTVTINKSALLFLPFLPFFSKLYHEWEHSRRKINQFIRLFPLKTVNEEKTLKIKDYI